MFDIFGNRLAQRDQPTLEEEYTAYIQSAKWRKKAQAAIKRAGDKCERCGMSKWSSPLEVHHKHYQNFENEKPEDLEVVCRKCHKKADEERRKQTEQRQAQRLYDARLDGWAKKVYGEEWERYEDYEEVEYAFDEWLEKRGE